MHSAGCGSFSREPNRYEAGTTLILRVNFKANFGTIHVKAKIWTGGYTRNTVFKLWSKRVDVRPFKAVGAFNKGSLRRKITNVIESVVCAI